MLTCSIPLLLILLLFAIPSEVRSIRFYLNAGEKRCFTQEIGFERRMRGDVRVTDGKGEATVTVVIKNPEGHVIYQKSELEHGKFSWKSDPMPEGVYDDDLDYAYAEEEKPYEICIENYARRGHERRMIFMEMTEEYRARSREAKREHVDRVQESLIRMSDLLNGMIAEMSMLENRERRLVNMTKATNTRLTIFASMSFFVIVVVAAYQSRYYRSYFRTKKLI